MATKGSFVLEDRRIKRYVMGENTNKRSKAITMTSGSLWKNIFLFSVPLLFSQLLEIMFNLSDVAVVGQFADYKALGAVGSTTLLVTLFTSFLIGMGSGVNVQVALGLGANNKKAVKKTIHSALLICAFVGIVVAAVGFLFAENILSMMNTKDEFIDEAVMYLKIYSIGLPAMAVYNFGNGVLSASGDTRRPLIYLTIAGILNVILNLFFVIVCNMAASGVALASAIAQYVSAVLIITNLLRRKDACRLSVQKIRIHRDAAKAVLMIGLPTGFQNAIFAIANIFVQVGVNSFDAIIVSGNSAAINADSIIFNVMAAFYTACASFIGQNRGARNKERMIKSYRISLLYSFLVGALLGILLLVFGRQFLGCFATEPAVIDAGMNRIHVMWFAYAVSAFMDCTIAASRGIGKTVVPTIIVIMGSCVFRILWVYTIFAYFHTQAFLYLLYFFSWTFTAVAEIIYFKVTFHKMMKKMEL